MAEAGLAPAVAAMTPKSLLVSWANDQDAWIRQLVSEVIVSQKAMSESHLAAIYETFLREKGLAAGTALQVPRLSDDPSSLDVGAALLITRLHELQNVNALAEGQAIEFNQRLTIVYGENACGKTGYVRVLKKIAAVRTAEVVLPDVSKVGALKQAPSANIGFKLGSDDEKVVPWKDEAGLQPFNRIDVFDSRATVLHVDGDLNYVYTPGELSRFPLVQQGIEGVKGRLDQSLREATPQGNGFLAQFNRQSRIYPFIDSLGAATDIAELRNLSLVSGEEQQSMPTLSEEVEALQTTNPGAQLRLAETAKQNLDVVLKAFSAFGKFDTDAFNQSLERLSSAQDQYEAVTQKSFAGLPIPGILQEEWRQFIQAGETYLRTLGDTAAYPETGKDCLYCRQPLAAEAAELLRKYRTYCNNALRTELDSAQQAINLIRRGFQQGLDLADLERRLAEVLANGRGLDAEKGLRLQAYLARGKAICESLESKNRVEWKEQAEETADLLKILRDRQTDNSSLIKDLTERQDKRQEALRDRQAKLLDIESRLKLQSLMPGIEKTVEQAKWDDKAKIQQRKMPALLRSLTETSKAASEQLLNRDFGRLFKDECRSLRAPNVTLLFPGRQGQVTRKKSVSAGEHKPSDVLSEGEQKVIALADFLAEASLKPPAPVVFDDPINSLDYKRMTEVVNRIVLLSESRQVIVFTHNIWFATELLAQFEKKPNECSYYDVSRDGSRIGIVSKGTHPRSDTVSSLKGRINTLVQAAEKSTGEAQAAVIEKAYELIRNICEVIVEKELLQGVTQRYQPNVMMTKLPEINFGGLEKAVSALYPIYEDSCRYIGSHSQPMETLNVRPTMEMLRKDWKQVQEIRDGNLRKT